MKVVTTNSLCCKTLNKMSDSLSLQNQLETQVKRKEITLRTNESLDLYTTLSKI